MCLAVPMKVVEIEENTATVEVSGTQRTVGLDIIDPPPKVGEYVIVHAGFAINIIDEVEAKSIIEDFEVLFSDENETY
ncbi:HypC/HybG/HupF family hydrogenase formation chaperone [candidate division KSB1 bacterium]|nr:HypC/HybG/HupF family hydrogenase formation chaperone [candidate division KSB1 bacterium]